MPGTFLLIPHTPRSNDRLGSFTLQECQQIPSQRTFGDNWKEIQGTVSIALKKSHGQPVPKTRQPSLDWDAAEILPSPFHQSLSRPSLSPSTFQILMTAHLKTLGTLREEERTENSRKDQKREALSQKG